MAGDDEDDDDFFSDDGLDALPANTLEQLEQSAYTSTPKPSPAPAPSAFLRKQAHNASSLHKPGVLQKNLPWRPPQPSRALSQVQRASNGPPLSAPEPPSSDYGMDDEEVIDLDEPSMVIQPATRQHTARPLQQGQRYGAKAPLDPETEAAFAAADAELGGASFGRWQQQPVAVPNGVAADKPMDVSSLQARIAELEAEQVRLKQAQEEARNEARAKLGEIAIVRSNHEKVSKQYEARISVMQRLHADEIAKQKSELDAGRKEREKMETDNRFLQHDLAQEAERAKRINSSSRPRGATSTQNGTPRKTKRAHLGDGFDDDEVHLISPSKSREKTRESTPRVGGKRKRAVNDSPTAALSFTQPSRLVQHESSDQVVAAVDEPAVVVKDDSKYQFMQLILSHRPHEGHERSIEALTKYALPSDPKQTLAAMLVDRMSEHATTEESLQLHVARTLLNLWSSCLANAYFTPFYLIMDLLRFALHYELASTRSQLLEQAIPLCKQTMDLITVPVARACTNKTFAASLDRSALDRLADELHIDDVLDFLYDLCNAASLYPDRIEMFWRTMDFHATLVVLNRAQPLNQIMTMLQLLDTSARSTSFGVIGREAEKQAEQEKLTVDRLTNLLFEMPVVPADEPPYSDQEILNLRLQVLKVLREACRTDHGTFLLKQHRSVIGRLVRFLDAQVSRLYRVTPSIGQPEPPSTHERPTYDLIAQAVNLTTRLLHHILRAHDSDTGIVQKLNAVHGGYHKFLVSLTRIAFSEQLVFEAGIEDEAAEAAHNILDDVLGPEDGEAVMRAVETPKGTKGSVTERNTTSGELSERADDTTMDEGG